MEEYHYGVLSFVLGMVLLSNSLIIVMILHGLSPEDALNIVESFPIPFPVNDKPCSDIDMIKPGEDYPFFQFT